MCAYAMTSLCKIRINEPSILQHSSSASPILRREYHVFVAISKLALFLRALSINEYLHGAFVEPNTHTVHSHRPRVPIIAPPELLTRASHIAEKDLCVLCAILSKIRHGGFHMV